MSIKDNPLVALIEESIRLKDSAQFILTDAVGSTSLTRLERLVLIMISESDAPMTASQVSRHVGHPRQVVQRAVNRLLELQLIDKQPNPDHKTSPLLSATNKGKEFENQLGGKLVNIVDSLLTESDLKMCQRMLKDIKKLRRIIEDFEKQQQE
ncbi:helix-turn-helix domain-containing protein [Halioxenophilus sp. WMMB6]|uniref:MarR family winged helix-turn-helix transcriptional regulator n=1 Tax=Halioxenophilus sp. WMMB6 TaxID=3073815 RepID=UPI00295E5122|nr:helix-turn-helix domain-containing protein [Halioxenophilus sp. WMMB6]